MSGLFVVNLILALAVIVGIGLTLLGLPGNLIIFIGAVAYGYYDGFIHFTPVYLGWLFGALLLGEILEFGAGMLGARRQKASGWGMFAASAGGIIGALLGTMVIPLAGSILGAVFGAFGACYLVEYHRTNNAERAGRAARGAAIGLLFGTLFKLAVGVGMVISILSRLPWVLPWRFPH